LVYILGGLSFANAIYTLTRKRHYRLFQADVNVAPTTPAARRVKVDSSPVVSSPFRFLTNLIASASAESRAHPDEMQDVWEVPVWDPTPVGLSLLVLFSPGHIFIISLFLPYSPLDPRPSVTVAKTMLLCALLSVQGHFLQKRFSEQSKQSANIYREVSKEYESKYVQPNAIKRPVRDVGVQFPHPSPKWDGQEQSWKAVPEVVSGSPYVPHRGFHTKPNQAYSSHYDPHHLGGTDSDTTRPRSMATPAVRQQLQYTSTGNGGLPELSSPLRPPTFFRPFPSPERPQYKSTGTGDGGSLGVYSHHASPLRKTASSNVLRKDHERSQREGSPLKRLSTPAGGLHQRFVISKDDGRRDHGPF
jgi:hypothetical protein